MLVEYRKSVREERMSVFALKLIAAISMIADHAAFALLHRQAIGAGMGEIVRGFGRIAFPVYAFLLVNGFSKSSDRLRYAARLIIFALISQLPFSLVWADGNYSAVPDFAALHLSFADSAAVCLILSAAAFAVFYAMKRGWAVSITAALAFFLCGITVDAGGYTLLAEGLNVFYTLFFGMAAMLMLESAQGDKKVFRVYFAPAFIILVLMCAYLRRADYGAEGLALIVILYLSRENRKIQAAFAALWCAFIYRRISVIWLALSLLSAVLMLLYNGRPGKRAKSVFYSVYPVHLLIIAIITILTI